ncbi:MAG: lactamase [Clostridiales bacterium]|nr:lactamase [Clostridiales bacterium]
MSNTDWFTVEKIDNQTFAISEYGHWEHVHSYLLIGHERAALIDTGLGIGNLRSVVDQLTKLPVIILTTHVHWDHIGSHGLINKIYVHTKEKDWLENGIPGLSIEQIRKDVFRDITKPLPPSVQPENYNLFKGKPTGLFQDKDVFELGGRKLKVIDTPGLQFRTIWYSLLRKSQIWKKKFQKFLVDITNLVWIHLFCTKREKMLIF